MNAITLGLFPRVLLTMLFIAMIPIAVFYYMINVQTKQQLENKTRQTLQLTASDLSHQVNSWIDTNIRLLKQNAALPAIRSMETSRQKPIVDAMLAHYEWSYLVFTVDKEGYKTARSDELPIFFDDGTKAHYRGDRDYFRQVMDGQDVGKQVLLSRTTGKPALCLSVSIAEGVGVLAQCSQLDAVSLSITNVRIGDTGFAMLVDNEGRLIAHGDEALVAKDLQDIGSHPSLSLASNEPATYVDETGKRIVAVTKETALGWTLIVQQDFNEAFRTVIVAERIGYLLLLGTVLLVLIAANFLARWVTKPIQNLIRVTEGISQGELDAQIKEVERSDEIGHLAKAIERLQISVRVAVRELTKKQ